ncbi:GIY-YIG catalytic domain-containing endonuclease [Acanthocystis turfacea Chlorella virus TN603.4.2]|nr:GIY-YIG catalytic domain-containing endonuclease [Acanthocystis turfacea Chlorella virus TN603.4.2]
MLITNKTLEFLSIVYFVLDNVMFWEAFRWERLDLGHIYIQKFSNDKMYAGQTTNIISRMNKYKNLKGSNKHHTRALKKHIDTMKISFVQCPRYILDTVEIFVIAFFDLTDPNKGYNKTTGGRNGYSMSKEVRMRMSNLHKGENHPQFGKRGELSHNFGRPCPEEKRATISKALSGKNHPQFGKRGELSHNFGKTLPEETRAKISKSNIGKTRTTGTRANMSIAQTGEKNGFFGKTHTKEARSQMSAKLSGENHPMFCKHHKEETRVKLSSINIGEKNPRSKPICVFGKLYGITSIASDTLRDVCNTTRDDNFIAKWVHNPKHQHNVFYVSREFYEVMKDTTKFITREMYDKYVM